MRGATNGESAGVVVEIRGGTLVAVYTDVPNAQVVLVDWDDVEAGDTPGAVIHESLASAPPEIRRYYETSCPTS